MSAFFWVWSEFFKDLTGLSSVKLRPSRGPLLLFSLVVWKVIVHKASQGIGRVLSFDPFFGTKQSGLCHSTAENFSERKT